MANPKNARHPRDLAERLGRAGMLDEVAARRLGVPRRRKRPKPCSTAAIAFAEVHFHFTHLLHSLRELDGLEPKVLPSGSFGLDRILCLFIVGKLVSIDEAVTVFIRDAGKTPDYRDVLRATKPLLVRARRSIGAIKAMRNRWLAHGWSRQKGIRDSPLLARLESGAPESTEELRFITILYLQYVCTIIVASPGLLLEAHEYMRQTSRETPLLNESIAPSDFEAEARQLVHQVCSELGMEDLPVVVYDPDAL